MAQPKRHGAYSLIAKGKFPEHARHIRGFLEITRRRLIIENGPNEADIPVGCILLIDRVVAKLGVCRLIEENCRTQGVFREGKLASSLDAYLAFSNSFRRDLVALSKLRGERPGKAAVDPLEIVAAADRGEFDEEIKAADAKLED